MKEKLADFAAGYSTEEETAESIHDTYQKTGYVMDTHTAVAAHVCGQYRAKSGDQTKCVIASTASPYKFVKSVRCAIRMQRMQMQMNLIFFQNCRKYPVFRCHRQLKIFWMQKYFMIWNVMQDKMKDTVKGILGV